MPTTQFQLVSTETTTTYRLRNAPPVARPDGTPATPTDLEVVRYSTPDGTPDEEYILLESGNDLVTYDALADAPLWLRAIIEATR